MFLFLLLRWLLPWLLRRWCRRYNYVDALNEGRSTFSLSVVLSLFVAAWKLPPEGDIDSSVDKGHGINRSRSGAWLLPDFRLFHTEESAPQLLHYAAAPTTPNVPRSSCLTFDLDALSLMDIKAGRRFALPLATQSLLDLLSETRLEIKNISPKRIKSQSNEYFYGLGLCMLPMPDPELKVACMDNVVLVLVHFMCPLSIPLKIDALLVLWRSSL